MFQVLGAFTDRLASDPFLYLVCALAVFVSGLIRGVAGFGFALALVPLLTFVIPPAEAVSLAAMIQLIAGVFDFPRARAATDWSTLPWLATGAVIG